MSEDQARLKRRLEREKSARLQAEQLLEEKSLELWKANASLEKALAEQSDSLKTYQLSMTELANVFLKSGPDHLENIRELVKTGVSLTRSEGGCYQPKIKDEPPIRPVFHPADFSLLWSLRDDEDFEKGTRFVPGHDDATYGISPVISRSVFHGNLFVRLPEHHHPSALDRVVLELVSHAISVEVEKNQSDLESQVREQRYRQLFNASIDGIIIHRLDGQIVEASNSTVSMLAYSRESLRQMKITRLVAPETFATAKAAFRQVRETGYCRYESDFLRSDGSSFPAEVFGRLFEINGRRKVYGIIRDITQRRLAQASAMERERKFRAVFESSRDGIILNDFEGTILDANGTTEMMFATSRDNLLGQPLDFLLPEHDGERLARALERVREQGHDRFEVQFARKDGTLFWAEVSASTFELGGKKLIQGILRDVTEQREREEETRQAREEAERANAAKSVFLATMSHEIRTPLNGILGFADLLSQMQLGEDATEAVGIIRRSGDLLSGLLNDLLDLSRIESVGLSLKSVEFDVRQLVLDVASSHQVRATAKDIVITTSIADTVPPLVTGDNTRTLQVVSNLIGNAVKHIPSGTVRVDLGTEDDRLVFVVSDNGPGFPFEVKEQLFEKFFQVDHSTTRLAGGTGLGLAVCREIVQAMGGEIAADSLPGKGATFRFWIPLKTPAANRPIEVESEPFQARVGQPLLVVEDQEINARLLGIMLSKLGFGHEVAANGEEALAKLRGTGRYAAILMDMRMPVMDGLEASRRIRAGEAGPLAKDLPIVAVTANAMAAEQQACLEAGMDFFLSKPIRRQELASVLLRLELLETPYSV